MRTPLEVTAILLIALSPAACGSGDDSTSTSTAAPPQESSVAVIEVAFDGDDCRSVGPSTIAAGEHSFLLTDASARERTEMWVARLADGHTYEEVLAVQDEAGGQGSDANRPAFVESTPMTRPASQEGGTTQYTHALEPGTHLFVVGGSDGQWICGSFQVTEP